LRPLPDLSDLSVPDSVLDPVADDFSQLLADQPQSLDSLQLLLDPPADQALADLGILSDAIDALGAFSDGVDATYGQLHTAIADLDYSQTIADVQALEKDFFDSTDQSNVDYGSLGIDLLKAVVQVIVAVMKDIIALIVAAINAIIRFLASLASSSFFFPPGPVWSGGNFPAPPPVPGG
jgi:hypothetical protein